METWCPVLPTQDLQRMIKQRVFKTKAQLRLSSLTFVYIKYNFPSQEMSEPTDNAPGSSIDWPIFQSMNGIEHLRPSFHVQPGRSNIISKRSQSMSLQFTGNHYLCQRSRE